MCLFCKIAAGEIPSTIVYEDDQVIAFRDIQPAAPVHVLLIPKKHIGSALEVTEEDSPLLAHLHAVIPSIAKSEGIADKGFRIVSNVGENGQQSVPHLHYHILGGRSFTWPPG